MTKHGRLKEEKSFLCLVLIGVYNGHRAAGWLCGCVGWPETKLRHDTFLSLLYPCFSFILHSLWFDLRSESMKGRC